MMRAVIMGILGVALVAAPSIARETTYSNARFGFSLAVPGFFTITEPDPENGDGRHFQNTDQTADLLASGGWITEPGFAAEMNILKGFEAADGWKLVYESKISNKDASYSGARGQRFFYARVILSCNSKAHAGYRLEYPAVEKARFDTIIQSLNTSLKSQKSSCN